MLKLNGLSLAVLVAAGGALAVAYSQDQMTPPQSVQEYAGEARVVDGDTLHVAGERIRLVGLDACEKGQPATHANRQIDCGAWATEQMELLIGAGRQVRCESKGRDRYDRPLAVCFTGQRNLNLAMLRGGYAFLYGGSRQPDDYLQAEQDPRDAKKKLWMFADVSDHRHGLLWHGGRRGAARFGSSSDRRASRKVGRAGRLSLAGSEGVHRIIETAKPARVAENFDIFDFELSGEDMAVIRKLARPDARFVNPPDLAPIWDA